MTLSQYIYIYIPVGCPIPSSQLPRFDEKACLLLFVSATNKQTDDNHIFTSMDLNIYIHEWQDI